MLHYYLHLLREIPSAMRNWMETAAFWLVTVCAPIVLLALPLLGDHLWSAPTWVPAAFALVGLGYGALRANFSKVEDLGRRLQHRDRMIRALALIHAPGIEAIVQVSRHGKMLSVEKIETEDQLAMWNHRVDVWWARFEGLKSQFSLLERNGIAFMDVADRDGSRPDHVFNEAYLKRWRDVRSTWLTLDQIIRDRDDERQKVRAMMLAEGFDKDLLPPQFS